MKRMCLDLDGVLCDFYHQIAVVHNVPFNWREPGDWRICPNLLIEESTFWQPVDFNFWANLPETPEAQELVRLAEKMVGYQNVCILTAAPIMFGFPEEKIGECLTGKLAWLRVHFPELLNQCHYLIGTGKHFCASPNTLLVDDMQLNTDPFKEEGGSAFLFPRIWNKSYKQADNPMRALIHYLRHEKDVNV